MSGLGEEPPGQIVEPGRALPEEAEIIDAGIGADLQATRRQLSRQRAEYSTPHIDAPLDNCLIGDVSRGISIAKGAVHAAGDGDSNGPVI